MGGVDIYDKLLASYRPKLRSKKWWWNLFSHAINLSLVAAYKFYYYTNKTNKVSHLQFRREIARALVKCEKNRNCLGGPNTAPCYAVRYDGVNHNLESVRQGSCVVCIKNTRLSCMKCEKGLHKPFSKIFHNEWVK